MHSYIVVLSLISLAAAAPSVTNVNVAEKKVCAEGWMALVDTCGGDPEPTACVKLGPPLQFVSWFHMQYVCDKFEGGYLPEPTKANNEQFKIILASYEMLYGKTLMYLGATDVTHENDWRWFNRKSAVDKANWGGALPAKSNNDDCMAQSTETGTLSNVNCEDDSIDKKLANVCMRAPQAPGESRAATEPQDRSYDGYSEARTEKEFYAEAAEMESDSQPAMV